MWEQMELEMRVEGHQNSWEKPWPCIDALKQVADLNEKCLELLAEQAQEPTSPPLAVYRELRPLWEQLDEHSRRRAAQCPFLLLDAGFADPLRWQWVSTDCVGDYEPIDYSPNFTVARTKEVANQVMSGAWYLVRFQPVGSELFLGMPSSCASVLRACSNAQITAIASKQSGWLRPRWAGRVPLWRELLESALSGSDQELELARMHGVALIAAELRALENVRYAK